MNSMQGTRPGMTRAFQIFSGPWYFCVPIEGGDLLEVTKNTL